MHVWSLTSEDEVIRVGPKSGMTGVRVRRDPETQTHREKATRSWGQRLR